MIIFSLRPQSVAGGSLITYRFRPITLIVVLTAMVMMLVSGCSKGPDTGTKNLVLTAEDRSTLEQGSKTLLSSPTVKVETVKFLYVDELSSSGISEATLGTLQGDIKKAEQAGIKEIVVAEGTRTDGEKMYVIWKRDASGKWNP